MMSKRMIAASGWRYHRHGPVAKVLQFEKFRIPFDKQGSDVVVKMIAAPVHKQDRSIIAGHYPVKTLGNGPAVGGLEGVGVVESVGAGVKKGVNEGDLVWINNQAVGTWTTHLVTAADNVDVVPNRADLCIEYLSAMSIFHTAHHLMHDMVVLRPGDVAIQTGASSAISQLCQGYAKARGVKLFQTMRLGRTNNEQLCEHFKCRGAAAVVPYSYASTNFMRRLLSDIPTPKLLLNHAGGHLGSQLVKLLGDKGTCVTYGCASGKPMNVAAVDSMRRNLTFKHFFLPTWQADHSREARMRVHQNVVETMTLIQNDGSFRAQRYKMESDAPFAFSEAWESPFQMRKPILRMIGEYGEWRRPGGDAAMLHVGRALWGDAVQDHIEATCLSDQPQSMKYYTPIGDIHSDYFSHAESREMGNREVFFRRPNTPRHNVSEQAAQ